MTNDAQDITPQKRSRGRPKGSTQFEVADRAILRKVARLWIDQKAPVFASLVKEVSDVDHNGIIRLRRRWKAEGQELRDQAEIDRDAEGNRGFFEKLGLRVKQISVIANDMLKTLPVEQIGEEIGKAQDKAKIYERLGLEPALPYDVRDPEALVSAVARFEAREFKEVEDLADSFSPDLTVNELKKSDKLCLTSAPMGPNSGIF